ncbi:hypothetical protein [Aestuariibius sp. HNIBRBA575]|uniref:hypothetical protein n=1 Tax=Aestuariibius sp. HNIBRBA575 TaxID=3233343 RepID=UPI0034A502BA
MSFEYTSTTSSGLGGYFSSGDAVSVTVALENGGSGLTSQSWGVSDILSASVQIGSYAASWSTSFCGGFSTDASGNISSNFCGSFSNAGVDNDGSTAYLFNTGINSTTGSSVHFSHIFGDDTRWTVASVAPLPPVPLPAGLPLLFGALGLFGLAKRRRAAA